MLSSHPADTIRDFRSHMPPSVLADMTIMMMEAMSMLAHTVRHVPAAVLSVFDGQFCIKFPRFLLSP